jgi:hypothetical protein
MCCNLCFTLTRAIIPSNFALCSPLVRVHYVCVYVRRDPALSLDARFISKLLLTLCAWNLLMGSVPGSEYSSDMLRDSICIETIN